MVNEELDMTKQIFDVHQNAVQVSPTSGSDDYTPAKVSLVDKNMPPVAGLLKWSQELRDRIHDPVHQLRKIDHG